MSTGKFVAGGMGVYGVYKIVDTLTVIALFTAPFWIPALIIHNWMQEPARRAAQQEHRERVDAAEIAAAEQEEWVLAHRIPGPSEIDVRPHRSCDGDFEVGWEFGQRSIPVGASGVADPEHIATWRGPDRTVSSNSPSSIVEPYRGVLPQYRLPGVDGTPFVAATAVDWVWVDPARGCPRGGEGGPHPNPNVVHADGPDTPFVLVCITGEWQGCVLASLDASGDTVDVAPRPCSTTGPPYEPDVVDTVTGDNVRALRFPCQWNGEYEGVIFDATTGRLTL